jgi:hypothetical protein
LAADHKRGEFNALLDNDLARFATVCLVSKKKKKKTSGLRNIAPSQRVADSKISNATTAHPIMVSQ